jgi:hypothetical protein
MHTCILIEHWNRYNYCMMLVKATSLLERITSPSHGI